MDAMLGRLNDLFRGVEHDGSSTCLYAHFKESLCTSHIVDRTPKTIIVNSLTTYSSRRNFPAFSVISTILWQWPPLSSLISPQQGTIVEFRFSQASWSSCNESACRNQFNELTWKPHHITIRTKVKLICETGTDDQQKRADLCLQHLHLQARLKQQRKTFPVELDWLPFPSQLYR